ncbi:AIG2-like family protein [Frankia canadensis]|uniref:Putative gamma-glutamylcyclotransferase n=1 Tax=Frankia canadensis TaxID=1836972 RepID=A0A2I2KZ82_9ACTN|nr:gamma-glutamylcyclotransferase family protein [Frankia canadensis]SNQ50976.1 AIG2-like family protein [Frankia canadensis]SOU58266.1 AIG2-like family protein [Frankia canadensis]
MPPPADSPAPRLTAPGGRTATPLFVYGTLMFSEVLAVMLGRVPAMEPAAAPGWRAAELRDRIYPGLVPTPVDGPPVDGPPVDGPPVDGPPVGGPAGSVPPAAAGCLLLGLRAAERDVLDAFEGSAYEIGPLVLADGRAALAYHWLDRAAVTDRTWDAGGFAERHLATYVRRCAAWRSRMTDPEP